MKFIGHGNEDGDTLNLSNMEPTLSEDSREQILDSTLLQLLFSHFDPAEGRKFIFALPFQDALDAALSCSEFFARRLTATLRSGMPSMFSLIPAKSTPQKIRLPCEIGRWLQSVL